MKLGEKMVNPTNGKEYISVYDKMLGFIFLDIKEHCTIHPPANTLMELEMKFPHFKECKNV